MLKEKCLCAITSIPNSSIEGKYSLILIIINRILVWIKVSVFQAFFYILYEFAGTNTLDATL